MSLLKQLTSQITALQSKIPEELFQIKLRLKSALENSEIRSLKKENIRLQKQIRKLEKQLIAVLLRENKKEVIDLSTEVPIKEEKLSPNTLHRNFIEKQNITITTPEIIEVSTHAVEEEEEEEEVEVEEEEVVEEEVVEEEVVEEEVVEEVVVEEEEEVVVEEEEVVEEEVEEEEEEVEEEEEEVEEEEEEEEVVVEEEEEEEVVEEVEEEEESVYEVVIKGKTYYVMNEVDSVIYDADENGDISIEVGIYKAGVPTFKPFKK
jgi:hypothetical protein